MELAGNTPVNFNIFKLLSRALVITGMFLWGIGESAGRARAASELARLGYHEEAKRLMLESK